MVYGCDPAWWKHRRGLPEFGGLKVAWAGAQMDFPDIKRVRIAPNRNRGGYSDQMVFDQADTIGGGDNSGFQAVNLIAAHCQARAIILVGFDMTDVSGVHWYGRNTWAGANNPNTDAFDRWVRKLDQSAPVLKARGVEVVNCSPLSALTAFPKVPLEESLERAEEHLDRLRSAGSGGLRRRA